MTSFLSVQEVLFIHSVVIDETGGSHGVRDLGLLESSVAACQQTFGGKELHGTLYEKAAALFLSLLKNHPFVDGNKRTAVTALGVFLEFNGAKLVADPDELATWVFKSAAEPQNKGGLARWISAHSRKSR